jgi:hypothetical protein
VSAAVPTYVEVVVVFAVFFFELDDVVDGVVELEDALGLLADEEVPPDNVLTAAGGVTAALWLCVLKDNNNTSEATVLTIARAARFISEPAFQRRVTTFQKVKVSVWMRRRATPQRRNEVTTAAVMPAGPQT